MKTYTVFGFYADNQQPWMEHASAKTPKQATVKAVKSLSDRNGGDLSNMFVIEVIEGTHQGCLLNEYVFTVNNIKKTNFSN